jgi:multidrug resistance efflux pump
MGRKKTHTEFAHLDDEEYRRAVNRLHANNCNKRKRIDRLFQKLIELQGEAIEVQQ